MQTLKTFTPRALSAARADLAEIEANGPTPEPFTDCRNWYEQGQREAIARAAHRAQVAAARAEVRRIAEQRNKYARAAAFLAMIALMIAQNI